jgi:Ca2+-binding EF-hand superfamily protein
VFEKWDKEVKGEIQPEGVREMLGEMGMHVTVEEAGDFVREVEAGGQVLKLSGFSEGCGGTQKNKLLLR